MIIKIKKSKISDSKFFYDLRSNHLSSSSKKRIEKTSFLDHDKWFKKNIKKKDHFFFNIFYKKIKCGYIRCQKQRNINYISICVNRNFRKKGIATEALFEIENKLKKIKIFTAIVNRKNFKSVETFAKVGYIPHKYNKKFVLMKKNLNKLKIINQIENIRKKNNSNWMDVLRLAYKKSPKEASLIMSKIYSQDNKISRLVKKLAK